MEIESLQREVNRLKAEKEALTVKSRLFEKLAAMAHSCCQLSSTADWETVKATLQKTLQFSTELTGAEDGNLVLMDSNGTVTDFIQACGDPKQDRRFELIGRVLNEGIGGWVSEHRQVGLIRDTLEDDRRLSLPHQPQTDRSVLAVPILKCDELLGILTLTHPDPDHFSPQFVEQMQATSDQIALTLENAKLYGRLDEAYRSLDRSKQKEEAYSRALDIELEKARQIQRDFLPDKIPTPPNWEIETYFAPAKQVSGDFYDVFSLPGNTLGIVIADVADKGVGSALYMALIISLIRIFSGHISLHGFGNFSVNNGKTESAPAHCATPDQLGALNAVKLTNDYLAHEHGKEGMFATLFFGVICPATGNMAYINAGHEPVFVVNSTGIVKSLKSTGPAVGVLHDMKFRVEQIKIEPGDILIGYTDGVTEAVGPNGDFFTRKRLLSILEQTASSALEVVAHIKKSLSAHIHNAPPSDDITLLAAQHLPLGEKRDALNL